MVGVGAGVGVSVVPLRKGVVKPGRRGVARTVLLVRGAERDREGFV